MSLRYARDPCLRCWTVVAEMSPRSGLGMRDVILMRGVHVASLSGDAALRRHRHVTAARLMMRYAVHELRRIHVRASARSTRSVPLLRRTVPGRLRLLTAGFYRYTVSDGTARRGAGTTTVEYAIRPYKTVLYIRVNT